MRVARQAEPLWRQGHPNPVVSPLGTFPPQFNHLPIMYLKQLKEQLL